MPQLAVAAWAAFSTAAAAASTAIAATLTAAGVSAGIASTIATVAGYVQVASQVIGGVQSVASALGIGQKQPSLRGIWEQNRLTVDASARRKLIVGRTAISGSMRAQFQVGKYKDWFWQTVALGGAGPIESLDGVVIERVTYTINGNGQCSYAPNDMQVFFRNGAWTQSAITSFPLRNASETPQGQWTANHRGAGIAHVLWVARENPKVFTKGKPQPLWLVKGQTDLIDPRTGTTAGSTHRDNPAVWEYTWRLGFKSPAGYGSVDLGGFQKTVDQLDTATYAAWANRCEALGWKVSGEIDLNEDREAVSRAFCQAGAAVPIQKGGKDSVFYQSVKTSIMTLTEADFVGDIEVQTSPEIRDRANGIVPRFRSEAHGWESVAGSLVTAASYVTEDGGSRIAEITFPLVVSSTQAGQLAAYQMVQSRERILLRGPIHPRILAVGPGEAVTINAPSRGFSNVKFIMEGRQIGTDGAITCSFRSETDSKHTYATGVTITVPNTSLPDLSDGTIDSPTSGVWTAAVAQITSGATSLPVIRVTGAVESFRVAAILIRYRVTSGPGPWNNLAPANRDATRIEIDTVTPNTSYDLEVSYISVTGKESAWTSLGTVSTGTFVAGEADVGLGVNQAVNSDLNQGTLGFFFTAESDGSGSGFYQNSGRNLDVGGGVRYFGARNSLWHTIGVTSGFLAGTFSRGWATRGHFGGSFEANRFSCRCKAGDRIFAAAGFSVHGATDAVIVVRFLNQAGSVISTDSLFTKQQTIGAAGAGGPSGLDGRPENYARVSEFFTAPSGAAYATMAVGLTRLLPLRPSVSCFSIEHQICVVAAGQTTPPPYAPGPADMAADRTGENTAGGFLGQGNQATTNIYRQATAPSSPNEGDIWEDTSTTPVSIRRRIYGAWVFQGEEGADITAQAVPSVEGPASVSFDVDGAGALTPSSQVPRTLQFIRKRGNTDVSASTTWSIISPVNVTLGTITNGGVNITAIAAGNSSFTVRSVRDGVTIDMLVTVVKNTIAAGVNPPDIRKGQVVDNGTLGYASSTAWTTILAANLPNCPAGYFATEGFYTPATATGNVTVDARLTVNGVQVGSIFTGKVLATGGTPQFADFSDVLGQFLSIASGNRTIALQFRAPSTTGTINTGDGQFIVNIVPTA